MGNSYYNGNTTFQQVSRFRLIDLSVIAISTALILSGVYLESKSNDSSIGLRNLVSVATISSQESTSSRKIPGTINWKETNQGDRLFFGDTILTSSVSQMTVTFDNGSELAIGPQSMIKIIPTDGQIEINLIKGNVQVKPAKKGQTRLKHVDSGQSLEVNSDTKVATSKYGLMSNVATGADGVINNIQSPSLGRVYDPTSEPVIKVELNSNASSSIEVLDASGKIVGQNNLNNTTMFNLQTPAPGRYTILTKNSAGEVTGQSSVVVGSYTAPEIKLSDIKPQYYTGEKVPIVWDGRNDLQYVVSVKEKGEIKNYLVKGNQFSLTAKESGPIEVSVRVANDPKKQNSKKAIDLKVVPGLMLREDQMNQVTAINNPIRFDVLRSEKDKLVHFEIAENDNFENAKDLGVTRTGTKQLALAQPGIYFVRAKDKLNPELKSAAAKVVIEGPIANIPTNESRKVIFTPEAQKETVKLRFTPSKSAAETKIQIAKDPQFKEIVSEELSSKSEVDIKLPELGKYYWRVSGSDKSPQYLKPSQAAEVELKLPMPILKPEVIDRQIINYKNINGLPSYEIKLVEKPFVKNYLIEVYSDPDLSTLVFKKSFSKPTAYWVSNRSGKFYYRVKTEDVWGRQSQYSEVGELIFPISPLVQ